MRYIQRHSETTDISWTTYVPWRLLAGLFLAGLVAALYYLTQPGDHAFFELSVNVISIFYPLMLGLFCLRGSGRLLRSPPGSPIRQNSRRFSPALLGVTLLWFSLAEVVRLFDTVVLHIVPDFPSPEHYIFLGMYPFLICAVLLLPSQSLSLISRLRILLDSLIIMVAVATLCYYFILAPILVTGAGTPVEKIMAVSLPQADLIFTFCLLMVALRFGDAVLRPVLVMLGVAILGLFASHIIHLDELLKVSYNQLSPGNGLLFLSGLLVVGAAQTVRRILDQGEPASTLSPERVERAALLYPAERWKALLPSLLVLVFGLLIFWIWVTGGDRHFPGQVVLIYIGAFVVLLLMVLRQFLAMYEISMLQRELRVKNRSLSQVNVLLEQQATTDHLTGLPNHRTLAEYLEEELIRARASSTPCSLLFIDIDHFKIINDQRGHLVGDVVLRQFGELIHSTLRSTDTVGRWGGEEFVVVLPGTGAEEALAIAERARSLVARQIFACDDGLRLTCSLGLATYPDHAADAEDLIACADLAMYAAKRLGRNQICCAQAPGVLELGMDADIAGRPIESEALGIVEALFALQEERDSYTSRHERRVSMLALEIALFLGLSPTQVHAIRLGGLLHDLGKMALPDTLLLKQGRLDENEFGVIRQHPVAGAEVLNTVPFLHDVAAIVRSHHEWLDGSGYPDGLRGEAIPLGARIVTVADAYDVITHNRPYHQARTSSEALRELQKGVGIQFDPQVVDALVRLLATSPPRTVVDVA